MVHHFSHKTKQVPSCKSKYGRCDESTVQCGGHTYGRGKFVAFRGFAGDMREVVRADVVHIDTVSHCLF